MLASYLKCKYCLWNTLHYNLVFDTKSISKFTTELYRRHKSAREAEMADALSYTQERLKMTNKSIFDAQFRAQKARASLVGYTEPKTKSNWDIQKLYSKWINSKSQGLSEIFLKLHGRRIRKKNVRLFPVMMEEEEQIEESQAPAKKVDEEDSDSDSSSSKGPNPEPELPPDKISETLTDYIDSMTSSPHRNEKDPNINLEEIEAKVTEIFKDNEPLFSSERKEADTIDDFLADYKVQDVKLNIFEQLPTKVFKGYESLIAIYSLLIPIINKSCPVENCRNGLVYYETSSESFNMKFNSGLSEFMPIIRLTKVSKNEEKSVYSFLMRNRTKYNCRIVMRISEVASANYKFKDEALEFDQNLATSDKEGGTTKAAFDLELLPNYYGDIEMSMEINLVMKDAENLVVRHDIIFQLGDEECQKEYLKKYY